MNVYVGDTVNYVSVDLLPEPPTEPPFPADGETTPVNAAIVVSVNAEVEGEVNLATFTPEGLLIAVLAVVKDDGKAPGTWHHREVSEEPIPLPEPEEPSF